MPLLRASEGKLRYNHKQNDALGYFMWARTQLAWHKKLPFNGEHLKLMGQVGFKCLSALYSLIFHCIQAFWGRKSWHQSILQHFGVGKGHVAASKNGSSSALEGAEDWMLDPF